MKRDESVLCLAALAFTADMILLKRTFEVRPVPFVLFIILELSIAAALTGLAAVAVGRKTGGDGPKGRSRFEIVQPLRRLFVSVWP